MTPCMLWREQLAEQRLTQLELPVLPTRTAQIPFQVDTIGNGRHQRHSVTRRPDLIVVLGDDGIGVTTGVRRVVPCAVVIDGPVHELQMAV